MQWWTGTEQVITKILRHIHLQLRAVMVPSETWRKYSPCQSSQDQSNENITNIKMEEINDLKNVYVVKVLQDHYLNLVLI